MNDITKVSEITYSDVASYLHLDVANTDTDTINTLKTLLRTAKKYVEQYTGRNTAELDAFEDFVIVVFILCQDMWDNRAMYVDSANVNKVVESILGLHSVNLL